MGFMKPKVPKVAAAPAPANPASPAFYAQGGTTAGTNVSMSNPGSMISTSSQGLTRRARVQKPSLIGSATSGTR